MDNGGVYEASSEFETIDLYEGDTLPLEDLLWKKVEILESQNQDSAFFLADLGEIYRKLEDWQRLLPRAEPFFALKCNSHPVVPKFLADAGVGFDCASKAEIKQILDLGVRPSRIIYANPCKSSSHLRYAAHNNVDLMTFDDVNELVKIKKFFPSARLILRMSTKPGAKVMHDMNTRFGCHVKQCQKLLAHALAMKLNVVGVSFHVGGQPEVADCFHSAIEDAQAVFKMGQALGFTMTILDIGGGFPGVDTDSINFAKVAGVVNKALNQYFPVSADVRVIAEPGRYFVTSAFTLVVNVIAKRIITNVDCIDENTPDRRDTESPIRSLNHRRRNNEVIKDWNGRLDNSDHTSQDDSSLCHYTINQGIYGILAIVPFDNAKIDLKILQKSTENSAQKSPKRRSKIYGPTCAPSDCVIPECRLPDLEVGQWLYFCNMGAYSFSVASNFNGVELPLVFPVCGSQYWNTVYPKGTLLTSSPSPKKDRL